MQSFFRINFKIILGSILCALVIVLWQRSSFHQSSTKAIASKNGSVLQHLEAKQPKHIANALGKSRYPLRTIPLEPSPFERPSDDELLVFREATVVESAEMDGPGPGQKTRLRILKVHGKYPMLRTEEIIDSGSNSVMARAEMVADHFLVTLAKGEDPFVFLKRMGPQAVAITRVTQGAPLYRVDLASASLEALPRGLEKSDAITKGIGEPDLIVRPNRVPNNPSYYLKQWAFWKEHTINDNSSFYHGISAEGAWDIRTDASSVIVAVIDTGVRSTHEALAPNMWCNPSPSAAGDLHGWNAYDNNGDSTDTLDGGYYSGHGTHCAGTIGAVGNSGTGVCGVAWKVQLMACKYWGGDGPGTDSDVINCIDYALDHGAQVLNCSFSGDWWSWAEYDAYKRAHDREVIAVCIAGNDGKNTDESPVYPACYQLDNIVNVTALSLENQLCDFSNVGSRTIHLAAPGESIFSTWNTSDFSYDMMDGTSCAAPFVTGAFALLKAQFPQESYQQLIARLLNAVDKLPDLDGKTITGGTLNIARALVGPKLK